MPDILTGAGAAINPVIGAGLGIVTGMMNDSRQKSQQEDLMKLQDRYDEIASQRNVKAQLELWNATNYPAQVKQMQDAGLNTALMYKGGGNFSMSL